MKCQEVMEFMQRQLDDDLEVSEKEVLMNHTRHCPDCAAMFERLKQLSSELNSLPKVIPSYSLVDAIMPELERIELEQKEAALALSRSTADVTKSQIADRRIKRERRFPSTRALAGTVAAGLVAGLFIIMYPPQSDKDKADYSASYVASNQAGSEESANFDDALNFNNSARVGSRELPNEVGTHSFVPDEEGNRMGFGLSVTQHNDSNSSPASGESSPGSSSLMDKSNESGAKGVEQYGDLGGSSTGDDADLKEVEVIDQFGMENQERSSSNVIDPQQQSISPDGQYLAQVKQYIVVITAEDNKPLIETARKNGKHINLEWSEDSKQLTYEVHLDQGAIEKYTIDVASGRENKAAH